MFSELNASTYKYSSAYYNAEFEYILSKIIACYYLILKEKTNVCNNENKIRDIILYNYLKKENYKQQLGLTNYLFDPEIPDILKKQSDKYPPKYILHSIRLFHLDC